MRRRVGAGDESGYVLFGVVILIIILGIGMTAAVPLWKSVVQRENEQELIWRGYQYMDAIQRYQTKFPGAYPPNLDVLVEQKFLRKLYPDPMTEDGEWRVLRQMSPELQMAGQQQAARQAGITDLNRSRSQMRTPGGQSTSTGPGGQQRQGQPSGGQFQSSLGRGLGDAALGGIVGVASASEEETFYQVPGKETYKDWLFVVGVQQQAAVVQPGAANPFGALPPPPGRLAFRGAPGVAPGQAPGAPGLNPGQNPGAFPPGFQQRPPGLPPGMGGQPGQQSPFGAPGLGQQQPQQQQQQQQQRQRRQ